MAFKELVQAEQESREAQESLGGVPILGGSNLLGDRPAVTDKAVVLYTLADMEDPGDKLMVEDLFTKSLRCKNELKQPGDVCIFREETHFSKSDRYLIALKYATIPVAEEAAKGNDTVDAENFDV